MDALSAAEITAARADLASMLPDRAEVQRLTRTPDGGGGNTRSWPPVALAVPCRLTRIATRSTGGGVFRTAGERLNDDTTHMVAFVANTDVRLQDRLVIAATTYEVLAVRSAGGWELARHVEVKEAV